MNRPFQDMEALLARVARDHLVPGVAAGAVINGEVVCLAAHGWRDQARQLPMTTDTPSRWYSISKPLTGLGLARLVAQGKLRWDQPVSQLVKGLRFADPIATDRATVVDCLLHRTGLPSGDWTWFGAPSVPSALLERIPHLACTPGFRAGHHYQNLHFTILGEVFRAVGTDWHQAMHDLLGAIGIHPLTHLSEFIAAPRALGHGPNGFAPSVAVEDFDFEAVAPSTAVCGSITELTRLAAAMAQGGHNLLPSRAWAEATQPHLSLPTPSAPEWKMPAAALAGRVVVYRGELALDWAGGFRGYVSHVVALPRLCVAAAALANRTGSVAADALTWELIDRAAGWETARWADRMLEGKRRVRADGEKKLAEQLARPTEPWPKHLDFAGDFFHPAYGTITMTMNRRLVFRMVDLPLTTRTGGIFSAVGGTVDFSELFWELRPEISGNKVVAWHFNPDHPAMPYRFARI